jgi:hypothetical protein
MSTMQDWISAVKTELGIDLEVDVSGLLDVTRVVAHHGARPAAPLTSFLIGYAAAQSGGGAVAVEDACRRITELAQDRTPEQGSGPATTG